MQDLMLIFHNYSGEDGDKATLSKKEMKKLIEKELPTFLAAQKDPKFVDSLMKDLDQNRDDKINFEEFLSLICGLSMACEECFRRSEKKGKK